MSRCINTLAAIVGALAASISALVGLAEVGVIDLHRPASMIMGFLGDAGREDPKRPDWRFEGSRDDDTGMSIVRTEVTTFGTQATRRDRRESAFDDLFETIESMRHLQDRLFRSDPHDLDHDDERR